MDYAIISAPAAPVRKRPDHRSEMINQLLFGEKAEILKTRGELWVKIRSLHDQYEGWTTRTLLSSIDADQANRKTIYVTADLLQVIEVAGQPKHIPMGSSLPVFENGEGLFGDATYVFRGNFMNRAEQKPGLDLLNRLTYQWLDAPYLWGGRTPLGVDCSGFVQVIFKMMGIDLPRDAWQQAQEGSPVRFKNAMPGDLLFFDNKEDIVHVGILLDEHNMIHASGRVRIDEVNKKGLVQPEIKRKLRLRAIRRIF